MGSTNANTNASSNASSNASANSDSKPTTMPMQPDSALQVTNYATTQVLCRPTSPTSYPNNLTEEGKKESFLTL